MRAGINDSLKIFNYLFVFIEGGAAKGAQGQASDEIVPSMLDLRVGKILSAEKVNICHNYLLAGVIFY